MNDTPSAARTAALYVLSRCRRFDAWSSQALQKAGDKFALDGRDRALCARLCLSVLQNAALCDYYIGCFSSTAPARLEPQILDILRLGVCQIVFLDRIPLSAAVNESVALAKRSSPRAAGLVNAVLRRIGESADALPPVPHPGTAEELSVRFSHPLWLCERLTADRGYDFARAFLSASNTEPVLTLSANLCRCGAAELIGRLCAAGLDARQNPVSDMSVDVYGAGAVTALPGYAEGLFFVQDAAAALTASWSGVGPGARVLDGCAAPGGKSFACAVRMGDRGEIIACDLHEKKLRLIDEGAARLGLSVLRSAPMDAAAPYESFLGAFDVVLADVPCSGLGVIRRKPEIRYKAPEAVRQLPAAQGRILRGLAACVRPGGTLLYSTCTVLPEENEGVIQDFLTERPDFVRESMRTLWPHIDGTDGFFLCRMRRNG